MRHHPFSHVYNFRDLGGYRTYDGRETAYGVFFRSDSPHLMNDTDRDTVYAFGVRTIVSLQFPFEQTIHPNPFRDDARFACHTIPLYSDFASFATRAHLGAYRLMFDMVQYKYTEIYRIMQLIIHTSHVVWYYCRLGSDRSGLISALILATVGVPHDSIIADYTRTAMYAAPLIGQIRREITTYFPTFSDSVRDAMWPRPETMQIFLYLLQQKYGSGEGYLRHIGITDAEITQLRAKFVVDAAC